MDGGDRRPASPSFRVELVEGVPDTYIEASRKVIPAEHFDGWEHGVRALYDQMAQITIEPDWAKLLDFETTIPKAVEDLVQARQGAAVVDGQLAAGDPDVRQGN